MNPLFQSAYEGSQAVKGEVGEAAAWSLGAGPGGGSPWESARAVCVLYSRSLWVGRSRSLRTLPPSHQPPGKGGGVREEGGGAAAPTLPCVVREQEDQRQCKVTSKFSPAAFSVV